MLVPVLAWYVIFCYVPMYGVVLAFKEFSFSKGILASPFIGLENFRVLLADTTFTNAVRNTFVLNMLRIIFGFPIPIIFALMLNEVAHIYYKKLVQTVTYLPHFISWVALAGIFNSLLALDTGALNAFLRTIGLDQIDFFLDNRVFRVLLIGSDVWKEMGWNTIIYLAAIAGIDPTLYEAAVVDGAGRWMRIRYITLPGISSTMVIMMILLLGNIMQMGFDQIYNLYNPAVFESSDIIDTYIVRNLMQFPRFGVLSAAGLIKGVICFAMLVMANNMVKLFGREGIY